MAMGTPQIGDTAGDPEAVEIVGTADELQLGQAGIEAGQIKAYSTFVRKEVHQHIGVAQFIHQFL